jgi:hypothetical protein
MRPEKRGYRGTFYEKASGVQVATKRRMQAPREISIS